jgi:hypothetical protein
MILMLPRAAECSPCHLQDKEAGNINLIKEK